LSAVVPQAVESVPLSVTTILSPVSIFEADMFSRDSGEEAEATVTLTRVFGPALTSVVNILSEVER
jgi:hypothetical protein